MSEPTYKIIRMYQDGRRSKVQATGLSLEDAQAHCRLPSTRGTLRTGVQWFDGYDEE